MSIFENHMRMQCSRLFFQAAKLILLKLQPEKRFFASELIRGALFERLKKELPYCCEVRILEFKEPKPNDRKQIIRIKAAIIVERESQKEIVIGKGGNQIKQVGINAREKLEDFLQTKVGLIRFRRMRLGYKNILLIKKCCLSPGVSGLEW